MSSRVAGWAGIAVQLEGPPALLDRVSAALPHFWTADGDVVATGRLATTNGALVLELPDNLSADGPDDAEGVRLVASRLELLVCSRLPDRVGIHAGVVAVDGRALLLPGTSLSGKSTLTLALVDAGATYLSDEYALLDAEGQVWPYPRPMSLRTAAGREPTTPINAASPGGPGLPIATIAALTFTGSWQVEPMTPAEAAMALLSNCLTAQTDPARSLAAAAKAAATGRGIKGTRDEATQAAARLLS